MQLSIFGLPETTVSGFHGTWVIVLAFRTLQAGFPQSGIGGLKWTRTIDLTRELVGSNGLGPSTSRLSGVCSNQLSYEPMCGGGNRIRTDDPLLAGQVLYQLSYTPVPSQKVPLLRK